MEIASPHMVRRKRGRPKDHMVSRRPSTASPSPRMAFERFKKEKEADNLSENTLPWYSRQVGYFVGYLEVQGVERMDQITEDHIMAYKIEARKRTRGATSTGLKSMFSAVRTFVLWTVAKGYLQAEVGRVEMPKVMQKAIPAFTADQLNAMFGAIVQESRYPERDEAIVVLLLDTMMRFSELCNLKTEDVQDYSVRVVANGNVERWLPISHRTRRAIDRWLEKRPELVDDEYYLFITNAYNPMSRHAARELIGRFGQKAGIKGVRLSPHTLRHTGAFRWIERGGDALRLQEMLGHTSLEMTRRYVEQSGKALAEAHSRVGLVDDLEGVTARRRQRRGSKKACQERSGP